MFKYQTEHTRKVSVLIIHLILLKQLCFYSIEITLMRTTCLFLGNCSSLQFLLSLIILFFSVSDTFMKPMLFFQPLYLLLFQCPVRRTYAKHEMLTLRRDITASIIKLTTYFTHSLHNPTQAFLHGHVSAITTITQYFL